jgi:hypothetical protein
VLKKFDELNMEFSGRQLIISSIKEKCTLRIIDELMTTKAGTALEFRFIEDTIDRVTKC